MNNRVKASDIPDASVLKALETAQLIQQHNSDYWAQTPIGDVPANLWDIQQALGDFPSKVVLAKLKSMVKRHVLEGCTCGCRGDFKTP